MPTCYYCHDALPVNTMRPYGPGGSMICHPCGSAPENVAATEAAMTAVFNGASAMADAVGGVVAITSTGVDVMLPDDFTQGA